MKRIALSFAVLGMLAFFNAPASASDLSVFLRGGSRDGQYAAHQNYAAHHQDLGYRAYNRGPDYRGASRYPTAYRQPGRSVNYPAQAAYGAHGVYRANIAHRSAYKPRAYGPAYGGASYGYGGASCGYGGASYGSGYAPNRYGNSRCSQPGFSLSLGF